MLGKIIGNATAPVIFKGMLQGYAAKWTIEQLREQAKQGSGAGTLAEKNPKLYSSLHKALLDFPSLRRTTFEELLGWMYDANPTLGSQMFGDPVVMTWLRSVWDEAHRNLQT